MKIEDQSVLEQAIAWHIRLHEADVAGWERFTLWLEASPEHARAYDAVALSDGLVEAANFATPGEPTRGGAVVESTSANDNLPAPGGHWRWFAGGTGLAAAAAAAAFLLPGLVRSPTPSVFETAPGFARTVALADGSRVDLAGGSRLVVDASSRRLASLERGEGLFHVRHDSEQAFRLKVGDVAVEDLGTVFSVSRDSDAVRVAVKEGAVAVSRGPGQLTLGPGTTALALTAGRELTSGRIAPGEVGGWRSRTLVFHGEPLSTVVERLHRLYALEIALDPNLSARPFTGMVQLTGDAARDVPHLATLIGTSWRRDGTGWRLSSADRR